MAAKVGGSTSRRDDISVVTHHYVDVEPSFDLLQRSRLAEVLLESSTRGFVEDEAPCASAAVLAAEALKQFNRDRWDRAFPHSPSGMSGERHLRT